MEKLLTCAEVARLFDVKPAAVWAWIRSGKLQAVRIGRIYRIRPEALEQMGTEPPTR